MERGAWRATIHGVLVTNTFTFFFFPRLENPGLCLFECAQESLGTL